MLGLATRSRERERKRGRGKKPEQVKHGLNIMGDKVPLDAPGALYQVVEGDDTEANERFQETIQDGYDEAFGEDEDEEDED